MANQDNLIKIRLDVDYAYPSRFKGFFFTALGTHISWNYLKNSKIIAQMVNESPVPVKAYWFFTPYTIPDKELLDMLNPDRHEVALHVATKPYKELERLEKATNRKVNYYTVHGTARIFARIIWKRKLSQAKVPIPPDFPLKSFYDFPSVPLDWVCYHHPDQKESVEIARQHLAKGDVLHVHPEWLFQTGTFNHRGHYYPTLKTILEVDGDFDRLIVKKKSFFKIAKYGELDEYLYNHYPSDAFLRKLVRRDIDILTFLKRDWINSEGSNNRWLTEQDNVGLLQVGKYDTWWEAIGKKTRNMVRKAEKNCVKVEVVEPSEKLVEGIWKIYNETPFRQGRAFPHYGQSLETVKNMVYGSKNDTFIAATLNDELIGFIQLVYGDNIAIISQILSLQQHWDKAVNNVLVAKAVEVCASKNIQWIMYGRIGNHPSLDTFKESNGFKKCLLTRYYVPLSKKGKLALALKLHRSLKDSVPNPIKERLFGVYGWVSRTKAKLRS
jgi:hypothetical protein